MVRTGLEEVFLQLQLGLLPHKYILRYYNMISQNHQILYINSSNRVSGTDEAFTYSLPIEVGSHFDRVCVLACSIPKSFYVIQQFFNTFTLIEGVSTATISITPGNYSYLSFMVVLPALLNAASPNHWTYTMTYPNRLIAADTGKFTYTTTGNGGTQPQFITTVNVYEQLGFAPNSTNTFAANSLTSTNCINFSQEETLFIHSDCCSNAGKDILQEVYDDNSPPMSFITYQNKQFEPYSKDLRNNTSSLFAFSLTNENGRTMNLNGRNLLLTLIAYKKDTLSEVIKEVVKTKFIK